MAAGFDGFYGTVDIPYNAVNAGIYTEFAAIAPPGGRVFWVRGNGTTTTEYGYDPPGVRERLIASVQTALSYCVAGRGDIVYVLEGHTEPLAAANSWSNLVTNAKIIGRGSNTARPLFTFTTAGSTLAVSKANVTIANCQFYAAGPHGTTALTVAAAFPITAAGFNFVRNDVEVGIDADQLCTTAMTLSAAADDCMLARNNIHGGVGSVVTNILTTTGAVDRLTIENNVIAAEIATAATGVALDLSNAAILENNIIGNMIANKTASSKYVIKPHASSTGLVDGNRYFTGDGGTAPAVSAWTTFTTNYQHGQNFCVTTTGVSGLLCPAADA